MRSDGAVGQPTLTSRMFITGLGVAVPPRRYAQRECWEALQGTALEGRLTPRSRAIVEWILCGDNGIATRHLALETLTEAFELTPDALYARFIRHAPALASEAARKALADAGCEAGEIDAVL